MAIIIKLSAQLQVILIAQWVWQAGNNNSEMFQPHHCWLFQQV